MAREPIAPQIPEWLLQIADDDLTRRTSLDELIRRHPDLRSLLAEVIKERRQRIRASPHKILHGTAKGHRAIQGIHFGEKNLGAMSPLFDKDVPGQILLEANAAARGARKSGHRYFYHGTSSKLLPSIDALGLLPMNPGHGDQSGVYMGFHPNPAVEQGLEAAMTDSDTPMAESNRHKVVKALKQSGKLTEKYRRGELQLPGTAQPLILRVPVKALHPETLALTPPRSHTAPVAMRGGRPDAQGVPTKFVPRYLARQAAVENSRLPGQPSPWAEDHRNQWEPPEPGLHSRTVPYQIRNKTGIDPKYIQALVKTKSGGKRWVSLKRAMKMGRFAIPAVAIGTLLAWHLMNKDSETEKETT